MADSARGNIAVFLVILVTSDKDIAAYAHWLGEGASKYGVKVHGWVSQLGSHSVGFVHILSSTTLALDSDP